MSSPILEKLMILMMLSLPTGFRFNPTDEELIELLQRKISGHQMPLHGHFILETDVYELDPQYLQWDHNVALSNNERFYYCLKDNISREVSGQGWWRATGHVKKINANYNNKLLVGSKRPLTFHRFRDLDNNQRRRNKAVKTNWIMHEYSLESHTTEWRLCKIKFKGKPSAQEELENIRKAGNSMLAEQQQLPPQNLQRYQQYSEVNFTDFWGGENQQNQQYSFQIEATDVGQQQQSESASHDPYHYSYFDIDQLEQPANQSQHAFPSLWSWQN